MSQPHQVSTIEDMRLTTRSWHRPSLLLAIVALAVICVACSGSDLPEGTPSPLPPVKDLATSEGLLANAPEQLHNCLTTAFSSDQLKTTFESYVERPLTDPVYEECDPTGMEVLSSAGLAVADGLPGVRAPFGIASTNFPDSSDEILALYERAEFRGRGITSADARQVEVRFMDGDSDAINIDAQFSGLIAGTSPTVVIGTILMFLGDRAAADSRVGGVDGDLTWLKFIPPQSPNRHSLIWARADANWAFSATANTEIDLQELVESLVEANQGG